MPPVSKKRKACIASTAKAHKRLKQDSEEELELDYNYKRGLGGDFDVADSDVEEELVIEEDALTIEFKDHMYKSHCRTYILNKD